MLSYSLSSFFLFSMQPPIRISKNTLGNQSLQSKWDSKQGKDHLRILMHTPGKRLFVSLMCKMCLIGTKNNKQDYWLQIHSKHWELISYLNSLNNPLKVRIARRLKYPMFSFNWMKNAHSMIKGLICPYPQPKAWITTLKEDHLEPLYGPQVFGCARWREEATNNSDELA